MAETRKIAHAGDYRAAHLQIRRLKYKLRKLLPFITAYKKEDLVCLIDPSWVIGALEREKAKVESKIVLLREDRAEWRRRNAQRLLEEKPIKS